MNYEDIRKLPDHCAADFLHTLFHDALHDFENGTNDKQEFLLILSELTDRQAMTYELLEKELRDDIDQVLRKLWNTDSYDEVDIMLSLIVNLGLKECFAQVQNSLQQNSKLDPAIRSEIEETVAEVGEHIANPLHSLERYR
ncbi:hypothetical protein [Paenibacillus xylanexedens]|uniref:hypothetical protein n=1 Tax=Paenibacillus xylanexedens TaxID=528191 RepID=UPI00119FAAA1|nr:hypothetical protein [Paenibacillus xylanexedens]